MREFNAEEILERKVKEFKNSLRALSRNDLLRKVESVMISAVIAENRAAQAEARIEIMNALNEMLLSSATEEVKQKYEESMKQLDEAYVNLANKEETAKAIDEIHTDVEIKKGE